MVKIPCVYFPCGNISQMCALVYDEEIMAKVLFVITKAEIGGAQKYVLDCVKAARNDGYDVAVASEGSGYFYETLSALGVPFHEIKSVKRDISVISDIKLIFELFSLFRKEKPDVIHLNSSKIGTVGAIAGKLARTKKVIFTAHGWVFNEPRGALERWVFVAVSKFAGLFQSAIICVSDFDRQAALHHRIARPEKLFTIHNGIDAKAIPFLAKKEAREKLNIPEDVFVIGTIANFYKTKSLDTLVFAAISSANLENIRFVIIGDGPEKEVIERLIEKYQLHKNFILPGTIKDANTYLKAFDIFVLPSKKEGLPYALLEAMVAHLPCIASSVGGIPEIIENDISGIVIPDITPGKIWSTIALLMKDKKKARSLGAQGAERVEKQFSLDVMNKRTIALYHINKTDIAKDAATA